jgi:hypothetical protein
MCLNETYSTVCIGKNLTDKFPIQNGRKQGDTSSPLLFKFALAYTITGRKRTRKDKLNEAHQLLAYVDDNNTVEENKDTIRETMEAVLDSSKEAGPEVNPEKTIS